MIAFDQPLLLLAVPLLAGIVTLLELRVPGSGGRRVARSVTRTLVLALAVAALAGPHDTYREERPRRLVVAIDRSSRLPAGTAEEADAAREAASRAAERAGLATTTLDFEGDVAAALAKARLAFAGGEGGGILLVTDGREGLAGLRQAAEALRESGVGVTAAAVPATAPSVPPGARIAALDAPDVVRGPFSVRAALEGTQDAAGRAVLRVDGDVAQTVPRAGAAVPSEVHFDELDLEPGLHELGVTLEAEDGSPLAHARRLVEVGAPPRVVSVLGAAPSSPWRKALSAQGLQVANAAPAALGSLLTDPGALPDLVIADAAALGRLAPETALLLASRVRDGLGLVLEPGTDPSAWAPLARSPLREVLPLIPQPEPKPPAEPEPEPTPPEPPPPEIDPPEPDEGPGLKAERRPEQARPITLLLVIDRSPSMVGPKMAMALLGAQEAARALSPWDRIGVITFADDVTLDVAPRSARGASALPLWLSTVEAGGRGTNIAGALRRAREVLTKERSPILHLILLTDGRQSPPGPIFGPIVKPMRRRGITITAIGIGSGARMDQLRDIVQWAASGRVIKAATPRDIPVVLTRDTQQVAAQRTAEAKAIDARLREKEDPRPPRTPEQDEPAPPPRPRTEDQPPPKTAPKPAPVERRLPLRFVRPHEALRGLEQTTWPDVGAPRRVVPTAAAAVLLERADGRPVLAAQRAGLGRVLQWTLPPDDEGAAAWEPLGRLFGQAARSVMAPRGAFGYLPTARVSAGPDGALLHVDWPHGASTGLLEVRWHGPSGVQAVGRFAPEDSGSAQALPAATAGSLCRLELSIVDGPALPPVSYLAHALPQPLPQAGDPEALAAALGAALIRPARFPASLPLVHRVVRREHWPLPLWLAIALLPLDVFLHRRRRVS